jgi:hypothetical protein
MKQFVLPAATLAVLFLTAAVLYASGWITPNTQATHSANTCRAVAHDQQPSEAALRYRQNGAAHWRCYMLQH